MRKILCGTPKQNCSGSTTPVSAWIGGLAGQKTHNDARDAFRCYSRYLVNTLGAEQVGGREFRLPPGNPLNVEGVLVLTKQSRFGSELRGGKTSEKGGGKRVMPKSGSGVFV
jgi:hypothetical protein